MNSSTNGQARQGERYLNSIQIQIQNLEFWNVDAETPCKCKQTECEDLLITKTQSLIKNSTKTAKQKLRNLNRFEKYTPIFNLMQQHVSKVWTVATKVWKSCKTLKENTWWTILQLIRVNWQQVT